MKKVLATVLTAGAIVAAGAGVASAADAPRNGDSAPHSTAPVTSVLNGDAQALDNVTVPAEAAVPVIGSKVGPYQGGNENAAPQADGALLPITNG
jgi:hypothetical protein